MKNYVDIYATFDYTELELIKGALQREGFDYRVLNENLAAIGGVNALGIEGARVQVEVTEKLPAIRRLRELGFNVSRPPSEPPAWMQAFLAFTDRLPVLGEMVPPARILSAVALLLLLLAILLWLLFL